MEKILKDDALCRGLGLQSQVCIKHGKGLRWEKVSAPSDGLIESYDHARRIKGVYEVGIFIVYKTGGGVYWTSKNVDVFNDISIPQ